MYWRRLLIAAAVVAAASVVQADEGAVLQCDNQEDTAMYKKQLKVCEELKRAKESELDSAERSLRGIRDELESTKKMFQDVKKNAASVEATNKQLTAELAVSKAVLDKSKEAEEIKAKLAEVQEENKELSESANKAERQLQKAKSQLESSEKKLKDTEEEMKAQAAQYRAAHDKLNAEIEAHVKKHSSTVGEIQTARRRLVELEHAHKRLEDELAKKTRVVYSAEIFWTQFEQVKQIFSAFGKLFKHRVIEVVGADNLELLHLQTTIWFNKSCEKWSVLTAPVREKVNDLRQAHAQPIQRYLAKARQLYTYGQEWTKEKAQGVGRWSEAYMDRLVNQLSIHDPDVRHLFPDEYWDRLACFAFLVTIFYGLSEFVQWALSTLVFSPLASCLFERKKARKSGTKKSSVAGSKKGRVNTKPRQTKPDGSIETAPSETDVKGTTAKKTAGGEKETAKVK